MRNRPGTILFDLGNEVGNGDFGNTFHIHAHCREARRYNAGPDKIIETGYADIARDGDTALLQFGDGAKGVKIRHRGESRNTLLHQPHETERTTGPMAALHFTYPDQTCLAPAGESLANAANAVVLHIGIRMETYDRDRSMAKVKQMPANLPTAIPMIGGNGVARRGGGIDHRNRTANIANARTMAGNHNNAVGAPLNQPVDGAGLSLDITPTVADENAVARLGRRVLDRLRELRKERVSNVGQNKAKHMAASGAERSACEARHIAQLLCLFADRPAEFLRHAALSGHRV